MKTWFITGSSSGFGKSLARYLLKSGERVVATARRAESLSEFAGAENVLIQPVDVTKTETIDAAVGNALEKFGAIDVLVNNAGYGFRGAIEEASDSEIERIYRTNFLGPIHLIQKVLPGMRARKSGTIINFSSIAAFATAAGSGYYGATKAALEAASDALRKETAPLGIRVLVVEPGPFKTDFAGRSLAISAKDIADYAETSGKRKFKDDPHTEWRLGDTDLAAEVLAEIVAREELPFRILLGTDAVEIGEKFCAARLDEIQSWKNYSVRTDAK